MSADNSRRLARAAAGAFTALRDEARGEGFYFFALFTTDGGSYVCATAWTEDRRCCRCPCRPLVADQRGLQCAPSASPLA